ncbi:E3 ubiquitin-protein ligase RHA2B-like [Prosopis cineraria]|uniref:E3 ubiquitin-protein ligase RHA2B-like n=1 Tax=Prosopis cineraria TaxID=364024 RepID=UPI00240F4B9D|nr:E3 ubiquitin-protein ligase RHA2B-like [Prosopis cineraria]
MKALSDFFFHLYAKTIVLLVFLLIELIILVRSLKAHAPPITISQYLQLIEEKNPTVCFTRALNMADEPQPECSVCLSELQEGDKVRNLKCKHTFHKECLDPWLLQFWATCPLCRNRVVPDDAVTNYRRLRNQRELIIFPFWDSSED